MCGTFFRTAEIAAFFNSFFLTKKKKEIPSNSTKTLAEILTEKTFLKKEYFGEVQPWYNQFLIDRTEEV